MKRFLCLVPVLCSMFALSSVCRTPASAADVLIADNDFSAPSLSAFAMKGEWSVVDGKLKCTKSAGACGGLLSLSIPKEYRNSPYRIEVDLLDHVGAAAILVGATGPSVTETPAYFCGYSCGISDNGSTPILYRFTKDGSAIGTKLRTGLDKVSNMDLHLSVTVDPAKHEFTYTVSSLETGKQIFGMLYETETSDNEHIYNAFTGEIGLRLLPKTGSFDNLRVTVYADDELPAALGEAPADMTLSTTVTVEKRAALYFGMHEDSGYAVEVRRDTETVTLYRIKKGHRVWQGERHLPVDGATELRVTALDNVLSVYYDCYREGASAWPILELSETDYQGGGYSLVLDGAEATTPTVSAPPATYTGETYENPVALGPDPDVLFWDGTYYLYNQEERNGNNLVYAYLSTDLVNWEKGPCVYVWNDDYKGGRSGMSPNVFFYDGIFYMLTTAPKTAGNSETNRVWYSSAASPLGPFEGHTLLYDAHALGGHPFVDDDGRVYFSFSSFDHGSNLHLAEAKVKDGTITILKSTYKEIAYPTETYEINGRGRTTEGGVIYKHNGYYYLFYAPGSYKLHYGESYFVSQNVFGPYERQEYGPILVYNSQLDGPGDAVIVASPDGSELYLVYHRHCNLTKVAPRQTCVDRLKFIANPNGGADLAIVYGPTSTPQPMPFSTTEAAATTDATVESTTADTVPTDPSTEKKPSKALLPALAGGALATIAAVLFAKKKKK